MLHVYVHVYNRTYVIQVGGYRPLSSPLPSLPRLHHVIYSQADDDIVIAGDFQPEDS